MLKKTKQTYISEYVSVSQKTILNLKNKLIKKLVNFFIETPVILGEIDKIVKVDETKLNHNVKLQRVRAPVSNDWAITIVDCSTFPAKGYAELVPDRSANTLVSIIEKVVRSGSKIQTDE